MWVRVCGFQTTRVGHAGCSVVVYRPRAYHVRIEANSSTSIQVPSGKDRILTTGARTKGATTTSRLCIAQWQHRHNLPLKTQEHQDKSQHPHYPTHATKPTDLIINTTLIYEGRSVRCAIHCAHSPSTL